MAKFSRKCNNFFLRKEPKYWMKVYSHALYNGPTYWKMENIET